jgi:hypothetical protein
MIFIILENEFGKSTYIHNNIANTRVFVLNLTVNNNIPVIYNLIPTDAAFFSRDDHELLVRMGSL